MHLDLLKEAGNTPFELHDFSRVVNLSKDAQTNGRTSIFRGFQILKFSIRHTFNY